MGAASHSLGGSGCMLFFSDALPFPGWWAVLPTGAVVMLLAGAPPTPDAPAPWAHRVLAVAPLVSLGWVSYSVYLYHWPLMVFLRFVRVDPLSSATTALVVVVAVLGLGLASYWLVERPVRGVQGFTDRQLLTRCLLLPGLALLCVALAVPAALDLTSAAVVATPATGPRYSNATSIEAIYSRAHPTPCEKELGLCNVGATTQPPAVFLFGDSHAEIWSRLLHEYGLAEGYSVRRAYGRGVDWLYFRVSSPSLSLFLSISLYLSPGGAELVLCLASASIPRRALAAAPTATRTPSRYWPRQPSPPTKR